MRESKHSVENQQHNQPAISPWDKAKKWAEDETNTLTARDKQNAGTMNDIQRDYQRARARARLRGISALILFLCYVFVNIKLLLVNGFATSVNFRLVALLMVVYLVAILLSCISLLCKARMHFRTYFDRLLAVLWIGSLIELCLYVGVMLDIMYIVLVVVIFLSYIVHLTSGRFLSKARAVRSFLATLLTLISVCVVANGFFPMSKQYIVDAPAWERHSVYYEDNGNAVLTGVMLTAKDILYSTPIADSSEIYEIPSQVKDGDAVYDVVAMDSEALYHGLSCRTVVFPETLTKMEDWSIRDSVKSIVFKVNSPQLLFSAPAPAWMTTVENVEFHIEKGANTEIVIEEGYAVPSSLRFVVDTEELGYYRANNPEISSLFVAASSAG